MYELPLPTPSPTLGPLLGATHLEQTMRLYSSHKVAELMIFHIFCWGLDKVEVAAFVAYLAIITQGLTQTLFPREPFPNLKSPPRGDKGGVIGSNSNIQFGVKPVWCWFLFNLKQYIFSAANQPPQPPTPQNSQIDLMTITWPPLTYFTRRLGEINQHLTYFSFEIHRILPQILILPLITLSG